MILFSHNSLLPQVLTKFLMPGGRVGILKFRIDGCIIFLAFGLVRTDKLIQRRSRLKKSAISLPAIEKHRPNLGGER